jgi:hypothetical protein
MFAYLACKDAIRERDTPDAERDPLFRILTDPVVTSVAPQPMTEMIDGEAFRRMVEAHQ